MKHVEAREDVDDRGKPRKRDHISITTVLSTFDRLQCGGNNFRQQDNEVALEWVLKYRILAALLYVCD